MIGQDYIVHWGLKMGEQAYIEILISISRYRGSCHQDGSPLRSQRTHTNTRTFHKQNWKGKKVNEIGTCLINHVLQ